MEVDLEKLERDLRTLIPVALALGEREHTSRQDLTDRVIRVVMTCARADQPSRQILESPE